MGFIRWCLNVDRRVIYLLLAATIGLGMCVDWKMTMSISPPVRSLYDHIDKLKEGSTVVLSVDYDPGSEAELQPMLMAVLRHCMKKKIKVIGVANVMTGTSLGADAFKAVAKEYNAKDEEDYVYLGFVYAPIILGLGEDIVATFPLDFAQKPTKDMPIFKKVKNLKDVSLAISFASNAMPDAWIMQAYTRYGCRVAAGVTAVQAAEYYPNLDTGQLVGLINGLKGAAEYETLVNKPERAMRGMNPQSAAHVVIIAFIVLGNIAYFVTGRKKTGGAAQSAGH
jgi:hypothetical protein